MGGMKWGAFVVVSLIALTSVVRATEERRGGDVHLSRLELFFCSTDNQGLFSLMISFIPKADMKSLAQRSEFRPRLENWYQNVWYSLLKSYPHSDLKANMAYQKNKRKDKRFRRTLGVAQQYSPQPAFGAELHKGSPFFLNKNAPHIRDMLRHLRWPVFPIRPVEGFRRAWRELHPTLHLTALGELITTHIFYDSFPIRGVAFPPGGPQDREGAEITLFKSPEVQRFFNGARTDRSRYVPFSRKLTSADVPERSHLAIKFETLCRSGNRAVLTRLPSLGRPLNLLIDANRKKGSLSLSEDKLPDGEVSVSIVDIGKGTQRIRSGFLQGALDLVRLTLFNMKDLEEIGQDFCKNASVKKVDIRGTNSLEIIGDTFCADCTDLKELRFKNVQKVRKIGAFFLAECVSLGTLYMSPIRDMSPMRALEEIGNFAFYLCKGFSSLYLPGMKNLRKIGSDFSAACTSLRVAELLDMESLEEMGPRFFSGCMSLRKARLIGMKALRKIGPSFFGGDKNLVEVDLSGMGALETVGPGAFLGCYKLRLIIYENEKQRRALMASMEEEVLKEVIWRRAVPREPDTLLEERE